MIESEDAVAPAGDPVDTGVAPGASVGLCEDRCWDSNEGIAPCRFREHRLGPASRNPPLCRPGQRADSLGIQQHDVGHGPLSPWRPATAGRGDTLDSLEESFAAGRAAIDARDWPAAIRALSSAALRDTRNADIQNYLGYAYRHTGQMDRAFEHYERALQLNPRHRGAHEYLGEAYLLVNDLPKAEVHLAALEKICLIPCEEYDDLKKAIAEYRRKAAR